jgi:hypothetical protein
MEHVRQAGITDELKAEDLVTSCLAARREIDRVKQEADEQHCKKQIVASEQLAGRRLFRRDSGHG